ncbi:MAG: hypothetical protein DMG03_07590, partial [Acidobacteria bacterium]
LACRRRPRSVRHFAERVAQTLSALHKSRVTVPGTERDGGETLERAIARAETTVRAVLGSDFVNRFRMCVHASEARSALKMQRPRCPIHGAMAWDCIRFGIDGKFYLYRFENCRRSNPGFDLGGFAADLACRRRPRSVRHFAERVAQTLSALHKSRVTVPGTERDGGETLERAIARAETTVRAVLGSDFVNRFRWMKATTLVAANIGE